MTHDFTTPAWGHDFNVIRQDARTADIVGWCNGPPTKEKHHEPTAAMMEEAIRDAVQGTDPLVVLDRLRGWAGARGPGWRAVLRMSSHGLTVSWMPTLTSNYGCR